MTRPALSLREWTLLTILVVLLLFLGVQDALAVDRSHCGPDAFSPPAPPEVCNETHTAPEPSTLALLALPLALLLRRRK